MPEWPIPVCLLALPSYEQPWLERHIREMLDACSLAPLHGRTILVKPNLLLARELACPHPDIVAAACAWLMDQGANVLVGDSPGFGSAPTVARAIGLEERLKPLGLATRQLDRPRRILLPIPSQISPKPVFFHVARQALECDGIFSIAKVKAHSQMRITLSVKNCYGCVPGLRKALYHALHGKEREFFAACLAAMHAVLPPVAGILDGIIAMTRTGPSKGDPFQMSLLGASSDAVALDEAVLAALRLDPASAPLHVALADRLAGKKMEPVFPMAKPDDFNIQGFETPSVLVSASFNPARLLKSCLKRLWKSFQ